MDDARSRELWASARFGELPEPLVRELVRRGERRTFRKGAFVHLRGDPADGLYRLIQGRLRVSTTSTDGRELVIADLEPGAFFGEISLFDGLPRTHDVYALERSELLFVPRQVVDSLVEANPELARGFLRALALKVRLFMTALDGVALKSVAARLALRLLLLAKRDPSEAPFDVVVSQTDLARMVGATRQSINKELKAWERAGLVRLSGRTLSVLNGRALLDLTDR